MLVEDELYNKFVSDFSSELYNLKRDIPFSDYIFLCVGSDKITGDSFGPLVGYKLKKLIKKIYKNVEVYGTLENPVSAVNLGSQIKTIYNKYKNPCIIAIDSALGNEQKIGTIEVGNEKIKLGKSVNKNMIKVGDISIRGIVAKDYKMPKYNFSTLQNTSLNLVMKLSDVTANGIYSVMKYK